MKKIFLLHSAVCFYLLVRRPDRIFRIGNAGFSDRISITFPVGTTNLSHFNDYSMKRRTYIYAPGVRFPLAMGQHMEVEYIL